MQELGPQIAEIAARQRRKPAKPALPTKPEATATAPEVGRNEPCPCGSGKKYKKCCGG